MGLSAQHLTHQHGWAFRLDWRSPEMNRSVWAPRGVGNQSVKVPACFSTIRKGRPDSGWISRSEASESMCPA